MGCLTDCYLVKVENPIEESEIENNVEPEPPGESDVVIPKVSVKKVIAAQKKKKSNVHYTRVSAPKRVMSGGTHLRVLASGQHSSKKTSQWWRAVDDTVPI